MRKKIIIVLVVLIVGPFLGYESIYFYYSTQIPDWSNPHKKKELPEKVLKVFARRYRIYDEIEFERIGTTNVLYEMYDANINYRRKKSYTYPSTSKGALLAHDITNSLFSRQERKLPIKRHRQQRFRYFNSVWISRNWDAKDALKYLIHTSPYGIDTYGINEAAKKYFNKDVKDLNDTEIALLAATTLSYNVQTSPWCNPDYLFYYIAQLKILDTRLDKLPESTTKPAEGFRCQSRNLPKKELPSYFH